MYSFRFPSATVTFGFVAVPVIVGIRELWARSDTGMVVFDVTEPTMACTPRWLISRFAALLASVGSFLSSTIKVVIFLPAKPPLAFASSTAISNAFLTYSPNVFTSPESGVIRPILISFAGGVLQPGKSPARRTANARSDSLLLTSLLLSCAGFSARVLQFYSGFPCRQQFFPLRRRSDRSTPLCRRRREAPRRASRGDPPGAPMPVLPTASPPRTPRIPLPVRFRHGRGLPGIRWACSGSTTRAPQ